jgi:hypothetical protein
MSFIGKNGFFGALTPHTGAYHPSVYAKYSRGGGAGWGTLGRAFAYKRPTQLSDGGAADDNGPYGDPIDQIDAALSQQQQRQRQPSMGEQMLSFNKEWGGGPEGVSQRFSGGSPYDIARATGDLSQLDADSADKIAKQAEKLDDTVSDELESKEPGLNYARGGNVSQQLADRHLRQNIGSNGIRPAEGMHDYDRPPQNSANNDPYSHGTAARGSGDQLPLKSRQGSRGTGFARGGAMNKNPYATPLPDGHGLPPSISTKHRAKPRVTAAWETKPYAVQQRTRVGNGMHIAAPHSGEGLVLNVHLSPVGPHALSLTNSGGVNVETMAQRGLQADARPTNPFMVPVRKP